MLTRRYLARWARPVCDFPPEHPALKECVIGEYKSDIEYKRLVFGYLSCNGDLVCICRNFTSDFRPLGLSPPDERVCASNTEWILEPSAQVKELFNFNPEIKIQTYTGIVEDVIASAQESDHPWTSVADMERFKRFGTTYGLMKSRIDQKGLLTGCNSSSMTELAYKASWIRYSFKLFQ